MLDYHLFGFNAPPPDARWARLGYLNYRRLLGAMLQTLLAYPDYPFGWGPVGYWQVEEEGTPPAYVTVALLD